ncbi:MAG TPA: class II aldolase/adducin family protein [Polyangiaceae bacterium]|nr:class II aldolase/adducin family protein [Polyangiaceae bacterium]
MSDLALRRSLVDHARRMNALGINQGKSGNLSVRIDGGFLVTPSGMAYDAMTAGDIVVVHLDGTTGGRRAPSSEWRLHRDIYQRRTEAAAIVHAHAMFATTLSCLDRKIPAFHYMVAAAGGVDVRCAPYATFGTQALSDHALAALEDRRACLHSHHGMTVFSSGLAEALALAVEVETLAAMYWRALQIAEPSLLPDEEMRVVLEKFETYGKR